MDQSRGTATSTSTPVSSWETSHSRRASSSLRSDGHRLGGPGRPPVPPGPWGAVEGGTRVGGRGGPQGGQTRALGRPDEDAHRRHASDDTDAERVGGPSHLRARGERARGRDPGVGDRARDAQPAAALAVELAERNEELRDVWARQEVGLVPHDLKRYLHPEVGLLELHCQRLLDPEQSHAMLVYTAAPGSESYEKLQLLSVLAGPT